MSVRDEHCTPAASTTCRSARAARSRSTAAAIAIFRAAAGWFALDAACPHRGGPLADGIVCDSAVICPLHDRRFDLATGAGAQRRRRRRARTASSCAASASS